MDRPVAPEEAGPVLSERASRDILAAFGIPLVPSVPAITAAEAADAADRLGYPVVMKADVAGVAHKATAGLVTLGVASASAVREEFDRLRGRTADVGAQWRGVLVQAAARGAELLCGMRRDPLFGPVVLVGVGGTLTEVLHDVAVRPCPVSPEDLEELFDECAAGRLIRSAGGTVESVASVLQALSALGLGHPDVEEVDVNPLFVGPGRAVAADALVVMRPKGAGT